MTIQEIKDWWKKETNKEIPPGWDTSEEQCLDFITRDSYYSGYNKAKEIHNKKYTKLRKLAYDMYTKARYLSTDAAPLRKAMDNFKHFICFEEQEL